MILWFYSCITCGGAELGMLDIFKILKKYNYNISIYELSKGDCSTRNIFINIGINFINKDDMIFLFENNKVSHVINGIDNIDLDFLIKQKEKNPNIKIIQQRDLPSPICEKELNSYDFILSPTYGCIGNNLTNKKIRVIPRGVSFNEPNISDVNEIKNKFGLNDKIVVGRTGNISRIKYQSDLTIKVLKPLFDKYKNMVYVMSGDYGSDYEKEGHLKVFDNNGINRNKIIMTGKYDRNDVYNYLKCFDIFLYCPIAESFGYVIVESMFSGIPVVCKSVGSIPETIINNETGFTFNENEYKLAVSFIDKILSDKNEYQRISNNAKSMVVEKHDMIKYEKNILDIFKGDLKC